LLLGFYCRFLRCRSSRRKEICRRVSGNAVVANKFVPILNQAGIDLMLCGHIHNYKVYEAGTTNARFPVVCNKNRELMTLDVKTRQY
jgi:UDP-2,3-diacylglucosamine pyrophosphatase LpxH